MNALQSGSAYAGAGGLYAAQRAGAYLNSYGYVNVARLSNAVSYQLTGYGRRAMAFYFTNRETINTFGRGFGSGFLTTPPSSEPTMRFGAGVGAGYLTSKYVIKY